MIYEFNEIKRLYDNYGIGKNNTTGKFVVYDKATKATYDFDCELAEEVKFANYWVYAANYGQSTTSPNTGSRITTEEYERAFNETSKQIYDLILELQINLLQASGKTYSKEALVSEVKSVIPYVHASNVVEGLFSKPNGYASFIKWCEKASGINQIREHIQK